jgi:type VI secretion system protein ImpA
MNALLAETASDPPCGPCLEYDPQFKELERTSIGKSEQQLGDIITPAEDPDWADVRQRALALFARTKDLRIALLLTRALVRIDNMAGLRDGLALVHALLERYWDTVHPRLDADGASDPITRLNVLSALVDQNGLMHDVRNALIAPAGPMGSVAVRDILLAAGKLTPSAGEAVRSQAQLTAAIAACAVRDHGAIEAVRASALSVEAIQSLLQDKVGIELAIDLGALSSMLACAAQACDDALRAQGGDVEAGVDTGSASQPAPQSSGEIRSREDAIRQLDQICRFFERTEPGNPAPLLIRRAQRLMNKNFVELIEDLAPESLGQVRSLAGIKSE